ncbi:nucleotidyltransferase family protein [Rhodobacter sp. Har01]|uniref:nucleotidyltransferase family protein n=1 Tax=Rhodobacter sp. Har01 TaxID=2883999 RepID=UPI001D05FD32|nr:nucleotidyltransferase family protein [Rhodobacter sp. Har01]MCB6176983.1 nucleotidyltransferase family protein [Rhodobacter sp. Har01]
MTPEILILAAGASSRMRGADKLLEPVAGQPLITHLARQALATGCPVTVALPPGGGAREAALHGLAVTRLRVPRPEEGMAESLKAGLTSLPPKAPVLLLLGDMPEITAADLSLVLDAHAAAPDRIHRGAGADGTPGHPVLFPAWARAELADLAGDQGAKAVLARHAAQVMLVPLPGDHATTDLDTPEDWARWRAARGG